MVFEWKTSFETVFLCISTFSGLSLSWHQFSISISHICSQSEFYSIDWYRPTFTQWSFITEVETVFGIQRNNEATSVLNVWIFFAIPFHFVLCSVLPSGLGISWPKYKRIVALLQRAFHWKILNVEIESPIVESQVGMKYKRMPDPPKYCLQRNTEYWLRQGGRGIEKCCCNSGEARLSLCGWRAPGSRICTDPPSVFALMFPTIFPPTFCPLSQIRL